MVRSGFFYHYYYFVITLTAYFEPFASDKNSWQLYDPFKQDRNILSTYMRQKCVSVFTVYSMTKLRKFYIKCDGQFLATNERKPE